jgi:hypothetical protein
MSSHIGAGGEKQRRLADQPKVCREASSGGVNFRRCYLWSEPLFCCTQQTGGFRKLGGALRLGQAYLLPRGAFESTDCDHQSGSRLGSLPSYQGLAPHPEAI